MVKKKKVIWKEGDIFSFKLNNNRYVIGQVLDLELPQVVRCVYFDEIFNNFEDIVINNVGQTKNIISLLASTKEQLDYGVWIIHGNKEILVPKSKFPNEEFKEKDGIGATHYDASIVQDFLNSFYALLPWDNWYKADFLDTLLVDINKKPKYLIYKKDLK